MGMDNNSKGLSDKVELLLPSSHLLSKKMKLLGRPSLLKTTHLETPNPEYENITSLLLRGESAVLKKQVSVKARR